MIRLISGYSDYSPDDLAHLGETVAANLPNLGIFSTLKPTPVEITAAVTALQQAVMMKAPGRAQAIKAAFNALADLLGQVADNAPQIANVTDTELAILQVLWDRGQASVRELTEQLYSEYSSSQHATVQKLLERLEAKDCVRRNRDRNFLTGCGKLRRSLSSTEPG